VKFLLGERWVGIVSVIFRGSQFDLEQENDPLNHTKQHERLLVQMNNEKLSNDKRQMVGPLTRDSV
jgi:hypothetical protein